MDEARDMWADYLVQLNVGNYLTYQNVLDDLIAANVTIVAPMMKLFDQNSGR